MSEGCRIRSGATIGVIALGLACAAPALAQEMPTAPTPKGGGRQFNTVLSVEGYHDTNVARSSKAVAALRGVSRSDSVLRPGVEFTAVQPVGRQSLFLVGTAAYDFHQKNPRLDRERLAVSSGVATILGPCSGTFSGGFARARTDLEDIVDLTPVVIDNYQEVRTVSGAVSCARRTGFGVQVSASQQWTTNSTFQRETSDADTLSVQGGLIYKRPALGELSIFGLYATSAFPNRLVGPSLLQDGFDLYAGGVRYEKGIGSRLKAAGAVSYQTVRPNIDLTPKFDGLAWDASLIYSPSKRLETTLLYNRSVATSGQAFSSYVLNETMAGDLRYRLSSRLTLGVGAIRKDRTFRGVTLEPTRDVTRDRTMTYFATVNMKMGKLLSLALDVRHQERDANLSAFSYVGDRIGLKAIASF